MNGILILINMPAIVLARHIAGDRVPGGSGTIRVYCIVLYCIAYCCVLASE